ncbi:hypothetical protein TR2A62_3570 [Thalassobium sp. R2A62]|nr:hypothetical protein TR2A62_3570 [Thalassobium sp. R2A62]
MLVCHPFGQTVLTSGPFVVIDKGIVFDLGEAPDPLANIFAFPKKDWRLTSPTGWRTYR